MFTGIRIVPPHGSDGVFVQKAEARDLAIKEPPRRQLLDASDRLHVPVTRIRYGVPHEDLGVAAHLTSRAEFAGGGHAQARDVVIMTVEKALRKHRICQVYAAALTFLGRAIERSMST